MESRYDSNEELTSITNSMPVNHLALLKEALNKAIKEYIRKCDTTTLGISFFNERGFYPHYSNGSKGRLRAINYNEKINNISDFNELVSTILADLKSALNENDKDTLCNKAFLFVGQQVNTLYNKIHANQEQTYDYSSEENNLGNSRVLSNVLAKCLCDYLNLESYKEDIYQELKRVDEKMAVSYTANEFIRLIIAIEDWTLQQKPENSFSYKF